MASSVCGKLRGRNVSMKNMDEGELYSSKLAGCGRGEKPFCIL
jgi:hypothetical protein